MGRALCCCQSCGARLPCQADRRDSSAPPPQKPGLAGPWGGTPGGPGTGPVPASPRPQGPQQPGRPGLPHLLLEALQPLPRLAVRGRTGASSAGSRHAEAFSEDQAVALFSDLVWGRRGTPSCTCSCPAPLGSPALTPTAATEGNHHLLPTLPPTAPSPQHASSSLGFPRVPSSPWAPLSGLAAGYSPGAGAGAGSCSAEISGPESVALVICRLLGLGSRRKGLWAPEGRGCPSPWPRHSPSLFAVPLLPPTLTASPGAPVLAQGHLLPP